MRILVLDEGEIIKEYDGHDIEIVNKVERERQKQYYIKKEKNVEQDAYFKLMQQEKLGRFIFFKYEHMDDIIETLGEGGFVKYLVIASYMNKDNVLVIGNNKTPLTKKKLQTILNLTPTNTHIFYKKLIELDYIRMNDGLLIISDTFFGVDSKNNEGEKYIRLYVNAIRYLYDVNDFRTLSTISYFYRIIPYIDIVSNIASSRSERDSHALTFKELSLRLGYSETNISKLKNKINNITLEGELLLRFEKDDSDSLEYVVVNPKLYYAHNNLKILDSLIRTFVVDSSK